MSKNSFMYEVLDATGSTLKHGFCNIVAMAGMLLTYEDCSTHETHQISLSRIKLQSLYA